MVTTINKPLTIDSNILIFSNHDLEDVHSFHDDALVVQVQIFIALVSCILVDNGSGVSVLLYDTTKKMRILDIIKKGKTTFQTFNRPLVRFLGTVKLAV